MGWGLGCADLTGASAVTNGFNWIIKDYTIISYVKICVNSNLPASEAHFVALHEYAHYLQVRVMASQSISYKQMETRLGTLFDTSGNAYPEIPYPHLEFLAECTARILNGGVFGSTNLYTHDCSGARGTAAVALLNGQLP
jgi:hypothetical protein